MSDTTKQKLTPEQRAIFDSIPVMHRPVISFEDRAALSRLMKRVEDLLGEAVRENRFDDNVLLSTDWFSRAKELHKEIKEKGCAS